MDEYTKQIFDGLLLGDGCLHKANSSVIYYEQGSSFREFVYHVRERLSLLGFIFYPNIREQYQENRGGCVGYHISTRTHNSFDEERKQFFVEQRKRWYPEGKKIVPKDIILSPLVCLYWYLGDGGLHYCHNKYKGIRLCTNGFTPYDREHIRDLLSQLGFRSYVEKKGVVGLSPIPSREFLKYIGKNPVMCYDYKWCIDNRSSYNILISKSNQQRSA